jgi:hypothetical protein
VETRSIGRVPFQLLENLIYIPVEADGHELHFLLDTGASATVIDPDRARDVGLALDGPSVKGAGGGERQVAAIPARLRELAVGDERVRDFTIYAVPMPGVSQALGAPVDGVLGFDFLSRHSVEVDYEARRVTFHPADEFRAYDGPGEAIPFTLEHNHIQVSADVLRPGKEPLRGQFTVDLGMSSSLILNAPFVKKNALLDGMKTGPAGSIGMGVGGDMRGVFGRVAGLRLGGFRLEGPIAAFSLANGGYFTSDERSGNIGAEVMRRFRVVIDYPRSRLILEKNAAFADPFEHDASGLHLVADGPKLRGLKVVSVDEGSPAAEADVRPGDLIEAIDGRPASDRPLHEWRQAFSHPGEAHRLTLRRGDRSVKAGIALKRAF